MQLLFGFTAPVENLPTTGYGRGYVVVGLVPGTSTAIRADTGDLGATYRGSGGSLAPPGLLLKPPGPLLTHLSFIPFIWRVLSASYALEPPG